MFSQQCLIQKLKWSVSQSPCYFSLTNLIPIDRMKQHFDISFSQKNFLSLLSRRKHIFLGILIHDMICVGRDWMINLIMTILSSFDRWLTCHDWSFLFIFWINVWKGWDLMKVRELERDSHIGIWGFHFGHSKSCTNQVDEIWGSMFVE